MEVGRFFHVFLLAMFLFVLSLFASTRGAVQPGSVCVETLRAFARETQEINQRDVVVGYPSPRFQFPDLEATDRAGYHLGPPVATTEARRTFLASQEEDGSNGIHLTYMTDCVELLKNTDEEDREVGFCMYAIPPWRVDRLVQEFGLMQVLSGYGVALRPIFFSAPSRWGRPDSPKLQFDMPERARHICRREHALVRFMVTERTGMNVEEYFRNWRTSRVGETAAEMLVVDSSFLVEVAKIGRRAFALLRRVHEVGAIHGSICLKNFVFKNPFSFDDDLVLVGWEMGGFICDSESSRITPQYAAGDGEASIWQMEGLGIKGFRDDAFRLLESLAGLLSYGALHHVKIMLQRHSKGRWSLHKLKKGIKYFVTSDSFVSIGWRRFLYNCFESYDLPKRALDQYASNFSQMMSHVRSLYSPESSVNFDLIDRLFERAEFALVDSQ